MINTGLTYQLKWTWRLTKGHRVPLLLYFVWECLAIVLSLVFVWWSKRAIDIAVDGTHGALQHALMIGVAAVTTGMLLKTYVGWLNECTRVNFRRLRRMNRKLKAAESNTIIRWNWQLYNRIINYLEKVVTNVCVGQLVCLPDHQATQLYYQKLTHHENK